MNAENPATSDELRLKVRVLIASYAERLCDFDQSTANLVIDRITEQSSVDELRELMTSYENLKKTVKQFGAKIDE